MINEFYRRWELKEFEGVVRLNGFQCVVHLDERYEKGSVRCVGNVKLKRSYEQTIIVFH